MTTACEWCGRAVEQNAEGHWYAVKGEERGYDALTCDASDNHRHAPDQPAVAPYDRKVLCDVLIYHYRRDIKGCGCGWAELGRSWPEHVATVYEESVRARA